MGIDIHQNQALASEIKNKAAHLGFDACGFAPAIPVNNKHQIQYEQWLVKKAHGEMQYMADNFEKRMNPALLVPGAKTVICLAHNYHQENYQPNNAFYKVSEYAAGKDYHSTIKRKLYHLLEFISNKTKVESARVFTDSAPVLERYWAQQAGIGAFGKNSCIILPRKGSYFFLAEIMLDIDLPFNEPFQKDLCGNCNRCIDACPNNAIEKSGQVNAQKCISYLTIEMKTDLQDDKELQTHGYIFGCDICQQVCPHNIKYARPTTEEDFQPLEAIQNWDKKDWENMDKRLFRIAFRKNKSALSRVKFEKIKNTIENVDKAI
jgi:epoxyqueuosine reductase